MSVSSFLSFTSIMDDLAPVWVEIMILSVFSLVFMALRVDPFRLPCVAQVTPKSAKKTKPSSEYDAINADFAANRKLAALKAWRAVRLQSPTPVDTWRLVVEALADGVPGGVIQEVIDYVASLELKHKQRAEEASVVALDVLARSGRVTAMEELVQALEAQLEIKASYQTYEVLLGGFASAGHEHKVNTVLEQMALRRKTPSARGFALAVKGFLKSGMIDAALRQLQDMQKHGFTVPVFAVKELSRLAIDAGRSVEVFDMMTSSSLVFPPEAVGLLLGDCLKRGDTDFAHRLQQFISRSEATLPASFHESMLKIYAAKGDARALEAFAAMHKANVVFTDSLCISLLMRCADAKFVRFAQEMVTFMRKEKRMTLVVYSGLMKVYAKSGLYDKACDLYSQILADGLEPDSVMYGCLMRFAAECGRTELSRELFKKTPSLDIQNFMSQFRAAARDKDLDRALVVFKELQNSGISLPASTYSAAYNSVLDVCVSTGDMTRARSLLEEMRSKFTLNIVTYNTFLKGLCAQRDVKAAKELMAEMEALGLPPNDISYNCLINACASSGDFAMAWSTIEEMERKGVAIDGYTVSTMLKASKAPKNQRNIGKVLALLDYPAIDLNKDEVLLNSVLDTCVWHGEYKRLERVLASYSASGVRCSVSTYGCLIKACGALKRVDRCRELWTEMTEMRKLSPNEVACGCMLDALVNNGNVQEAVALFRKWQGKVTMNKVMYSTLMKGFVSSNMPGDAMELWREMRADGVQMNTVVYNTVIDSQARVGAMDQIAILLEQMDADRCPKSLITHSMVIKGYCSCGDLDSALGVLHGMKSEGMGPDTIIYNNVIDCCIQQSRYALVDTLLEEMEKHRVPCSNYTVGTLVRMWGRRRQLDKAVEVFDVLPKKGGFAPNAPAFTSLISACVFNHDIERALSFFKTMSRSFTPDRKAYSTVVAALVKAGQLQQAVSLTAEAYGLGNGSVRGSPESGLEPARLQELFAALARDGKMDRLGVPLLEKLRTANVALDRRLLTQFLKHAAA